MTSKISFCSLLKEDLKKRIWLLLLSISVFVIILPIMFLIQLEGQKTIVYESMNASGLTKWFAQTMYFGSFQMNSAVIAGAVIGGISSFSYLHSEKQADFYHGVPVKRQTWYAVNYISTILQIVIPYIIGYCIFGVAGVLKKAAGPTALRKMPEVMLITILFFLLIYSITAIAMLLTGRLLAGVAGIGVLMFWGTTVVALKQYIMIQAFETYMSEGEATGLDFLGKGASASPILAFLSMDNLQETEVAKTILFLIAAVIVCIALGAFLYRKRPLESAGRALAFPKTEPVIKVILAVTAGMLLGVTVSSQNRMQGMAGGWLFGIGILSAVVMCFLVEFVISTDIRAVFHKKITLGISVIAVSAAFCIIQFDLFGYNRYIPEQEELAGMAMDVHSLNSAMGYKEYWDMDQYKEELENIRVNAFEPIYDVAKDGIRRVGKEHLEDEEAYVTIAYYLKNGRKVYRSYYADREKLFQCVNELMQDSAYRDTVFAVDQMKKERFSRYSFQNLKGEWEEFNLTEEEEETLLDLYIKEIRTQPLSVYSGGNIIGNLVCTEKNGGENYFPIYREYEELIAFLRNYAEIPLQLTLEDVKQMTVSDYRGGEPETDGMNTTGSTREITDPKEIEEILKHLCYSNDTLIRTVTEPDIYVDIETAYEIRNYYIRKGEVPAFLE